MLVLTILKIIGILLLVLLGLLFSAALLVLVVPLRYRIWMEYRESLKARISVSWLLKMAELKAVYDGELDVDVRALWFHPLRDGGKKEPAETFCILWMQEMVPKAKILLYMRTRE